MRKWIWADRALQLATHVVREKRDAVGGIALALDLFLHHGPFFAYRLLVADAILFHAADTLIASTCMFAAMYPFLF